MHPCPPFSINLIIGDLVMIIKDKQVESFGCVRYKKPQPFLPFHGGVVLVATLSDGTKVAGREKDYLNWRKSL